MRRFAVAAGRGHAASTGGRQYAVRALLNLQQHVSASVCDRWTGESKAGLNGAQHAQGGVSRTVRRAVSRALQNPQTLARQGV